MVWLIQSIPEGSEDRNLEAGTETGIKKERLGLAWLAQPAFLHKAGPPFPVGVAFHHFPVGVAFPHQPLIYKML